MGNVYTLPILNVTPEAWNERAVSSLTTSQRALFDAVMAGGLKLVSYYWDSETSHPGTIFMYSVTGGRIACFPNGVCSIGNANSVSDESSEGVRRSWSIMRTTTNIHTSPFTFNRTNQWFVDIYSSEAEARAALIGTYPITYRPTNCSFPNAPTEAAVGDTVVVPVTFPDGYGLVNESNIYVTNNGVVIPSTYSNGQLTFTMPDPS